MIVDSTMKGKCQTMLCFIGWKPTSELASPLKKVYILRWQTAHPSHVAPCFFYWAASKGSKYRCNSLVFLVNSTSFLNPHAIYNQVLSLFLSEIMAILICCLKGLNPLFVCYQHSLGVLIVVVVVYFFAFIKDDVGSYGLPANLLWFWYKSFL